MNARIGSAPVNFGVFDAEGRSSVAPDAMLGVVAGAGYMGLELGPPGYFGDGARLRRRFAGAGLEVIGAYLPLRLGSGPAALHDDLAAVRTWLTGLEPGDRGGAVAIFADAGTPELERDPAREQHDRTLALDDAAWRLAVEGIARAVGMASDLGLRTSFHPHFATNVQTASEIERLMETTDVGLTLDTGHFLMGGTDPREALARYSRRVNHIHLKDVDLDVLRRAQATSEPDMGAWWGRISLPLGRGDVELVPFLDDLLGTDYEGWLVVEQDRMPDPTRAIAEVEVSEMENRAWLTDTVERLRGDRESERSPAGALR